MAKPKNSSKLPKDTYFAAADKEVCAQGVMEKVTQYRDYLSFNGNWSIWTRAYNMYNSGFYTAGAIRKVGDQGEFSMMKNNQLRNIILNQLNMTTSQRPQFEVMATNSDYKTLAQIKLSKGLLDYYMRQKEFEKYLKKATEIALLYGEGFILQTWDTSSGDTYNYNPMTGAQIKTGDIKVKNFYPMDVIRDVSKYSFSDCPWVIVRDFENKYDLAEKFPEYAEDIISLDYANDVYYREQFEVTRTQESDDVMIYYLFHLPTLAVPEGRFMMVLTDETVLMDGPLPYRNLPLYRITPNDMLGQTFGYTSTFDLMPIQQAVDVLNSTVVTNQFIFGTQNILLPTGSNITKNQLAGGLTMITYDPKVTGGAKPEALQLTKTAPEIFNYIQQLVHDMETLSGINSVARGNPEASLKSGAALALVQSMAIQFNSGLQQSYNQLVESVGSGTINLLRDFASVPRIATIVGEDNLPYMAEFKGDDLDQINRVMVKAGNPLMSTTAGKIQVAQDLLQSGMVKTSQEYLQVVETGQYDTLIEGPQRELLLIKQENEKMSKGQTPPAAITDEHLLHIQEHRNVLASPDARDNPQLIQAVTAHIQEHINMLSNPGAATLLTLLGQQPLLPPQAQITQDQGAAIGNMAEQANPQLPVQQEAANIKQPNLPNPPKNPLTGEVVNLPKKQ